MKLASLKEGGRDGTLVVVSSDLRRFNTIGSISFDHPDPSIFLVLQSLSDTPGVDTIDFVVSAALAFANVSASGPWPLMQLCSEAPPGAKPSAFAS